MDRNQEYIRQLQERNRIKKMMAEKSEDDIMKEELERGFSTHFRGAHASKETANVSKTAATKPHVKVHTKAPSNDLLQRLMPPGLNHGSDMSPEQPRALSRGRNGAEKGFDQPLLSNRSNDSRDGSSTSRRNNRSRSGSRYQGIDFDEANADTNANKDFQESYSQYNPKQLNDFEEQELIGPMKQRATPSAETPRGASRERNIRKPTIGSNVPLMDLMQSSDLNDLLLGHIKGLSAEQKIAMIQLLQQTNDSTPQQEEPVADTSLRTSSKSTESNRRYSNLKDSPDPDLADDQEHTAMSRGKDQLLSVPSVLDTPTPQHIKDSESDRPSISLNVRIKIYSTWAPAKNATLQGIRLRYNLEKGHHLDILQSLRPRIQSGLSVLQQTSEAMRSLPMLIGQGIRLNGAMWKAPLSPESPIEIAFEGLLSQQALDAIESDSVPFDKARFELLIWNGALDGVVANSSPVKDMDVFVDNKCIWSGEIPEENKTSELIRAIDKLTLPSKFEAKPSSRFKLIPAPRVGSAIGVKKPGGAITEMSNQSIKSIPPSPARSLIMSTIASPERKLKQQDSRSDSSVPEWLRGSKNVERKTTVLDSPIRTAKKDENESEMREQEFGAFNPISNGSPAAGRSAAKSRRRRPRDAAIVSTAAIDSGSVIQYSNPMDRQDSDSNLRKSMEAVQHAEKFNLNRLESTLSKRRPRRGDNVGDANHEDSLDASQGGDFLQSSESAKSPSKSLDSMMARGENSTVDESSNIEFSRTLDFEASVPSKITMKIDDVNAKLNNALTDLAEIMASLPRNRSEKRIRPEPAGNAGNDVASGNDSSLRSRHLISENKPITPVPMGQEMPRGKTLRLQIFSTYGDMNYVGLNGLEIYDEQGQILTLGQKIVSIAAQPSDLGALPGYEDDPRKVENLLDGVNTTKDDLHQWLAPHMSVAREHHPELKSFMYPDNEEEPLAAITIQFKAMQAISMIRIFNFNKSRTHNQRGVKTCRLYLDNTMIYEGEIKRASGQMKISEADSQLLVFTKDSNIIERAPSPYEKSKTEDENVLEESMSSPNARPKTAIKPAAGEPPAVPVLAEVESRAQSPTSSFLNEVLNEVDNIDKFATKAIAHPSTRVNVREGDSFSDFQDTFSSSKISNKEDPSSGKISMTFKGTTKQDDIIYFKSSSAAMLPTVESSVTKTNTSVLSIVARSIRIEFDNTWGDRDYVGLSGIEVIGIDGKPISLASKSLSFDASSDMFGSSGSGDRKVDNVISGINNTANDGFMWLAPLPFEKKRQYLEIKFPSEKVIIGLRFWNYNGNFDATLRGARQCTIFFDDQPTLKYLLRPGPECDGVDFSQTLLFDQFFFDQEEQRKRMKSIGTSPSAYMTPKLKQIYEAVTPPTGLLWKFTFFNNHGDDYYIGLDAIDMFDTENQIINIPRKGGHVGAVPFSVRDLSSSPTDPLSKDPRTPDKLFAKSFNQQAAAKSCWLAPLARCMTEAEKEASIVRTVSMTKHIDGSEYTKKKKTPQLPKDNVVMVMFSYPVSIAAIRFYNYSKSVRRGAKDFAIHVDGKLVFLGTLQRADEEPKSLPEARSVARQTIGDECRTMGQAVVFSHDLKILNSHKDYIPPSGILDQDVLCINERQVMVRSKTMYEPPNTSAIVLENPNVDFFKRPTTSFFS